MLNPRLFKRTKSTDFYKGHLDEIEMRFEIATQKTSQNSPIRAFFLAAMGDDVQIHTEALKSDLALVRFAAMSNSKFVPDIALLATEPLAKYAYAYNQASSAEIVERIGMTKQNLNPVVKELLLVHPNKTGELSELLALQPSYNPEEIYGDEVYAFFWEALGMESEEVDLEAAEALIYLSLLDAVETPGANYAFWVDIFEEVVPDGIEDFLQLVVEMPREVSDFTFCVSEIRCWASEKVSDENLIRLLAKDEVGPNSGVGGFYWADSRTPRNTLLMNPATPKDIFHSVWEEELSAPDELDSYLNGNLWRLAVSQYTPNEILEGIIARIEDGRIKEEITVSNLLIGEPQDFPSGLANNEALTGELAERVQALLVKHGLGIEE